MKATWTTLHTFDALCDTDFYQVYEQGKEEVLRDHAFRILLTCIDTAEELEKLAYTKECWWADWTTKELIEITNHFRLLSSPENEIRLYRECTDETFRSIPRVREFYILALNKAERPAEAIQEGSRITAEGGHSALVWAVLGESYSAKMIFAEELIQALIKSNNDPSSIDNHLKTRFPGYFPEVKLADMTVSRARALRLINLRLATRIFRRGFRESGSSFPGLGWMLRTMDCQADLVVERAQLQQNRGAYQLRDSEELRLRVIDDEITVIEKELGSQAILVDIALEMQGGEESLNYWTQAGRLLLAVIRGDSLPEIRHLLSQLFATVDAEFELAITIAELVRIKNNFKAMRDVQHTAEDDSASLNIKIECAELSIAECNVVRDRFRGAGEDKRSVLKEEYREAIASESKNAHATFLNRTFNFRALTSSLVPLYIRGGIGRVGSRVPDLLINRRVQNDLADLVETKVLQALPLEDRENPKAVIARIQQVVGTGLKVGDLQDLQSPTHSDFDIRSDGLIALSGVDIDMRKNTRTGTDLTAVLLMQNGDCRETMYLNGTLFACWQQIQVKKLISNAMLCLELKYQEGFEAIVHKKIPALMRYQLRGGHFSVYVDSIAMHTKYEFSRIFPANTIAELRSYGIDEVRSGKPLTSYELENSKIKVTYTDGTTIWIEHKDPITGEWRPIIHTPLQEGGIPLIPGAGDHCDNIRSLRLVNLVEEHSITFLYDAEQKTAEFYDGFYNEALFDSPYNFSSGPVTMEDIQSNNSMIRAGSRSLIYPDRSVHQHQVYLEFLPFSQTDYEATLVEGDIPGTIQLMGRTFSGDLKRERRRLEEGTSPIPTLLEKVKAWQIVMQQSIAPDHKGIEKKLSRLILDLARAIPEKMQLHKVSAEQPLIIEEVENPNLYLVLCGKLSVHRHGQPLHDKDDALVVSTAGSIVGEISALSGGVASATVAGDAFVIGIPMAVIREQLSRDPTFRSCMEDLASYRVL